jgi:hypothetical protein
MVAQYDSRLAVGIGKAARGDSAAMRTIAFITLLFLPATFVSVSRRVLRCPIERLISTVGNIQHLLL